MLLSARPDELPATILSRCHVVTFQPLPERFVIDALVAEGATPARAALAARLAGGNLGRARRLATRDDALAFRDVASEALQRAEEGVAGALAAAEIVTEAAAGYRKGLKSDLDEELAPFLDARGRPEDAYRGSIRRIQERHHRRERRAERDYVDWVLLGVSASLRDRILAAVGGGGDLLLDPGSTPTAGPVAAAARALASIEAARAALAEENNLNVRLILESAFLAVAPAAA
jgi:DNA polymerase-3 subunit delta'